MEVYLLVEELVQEHYLICFLRFLSSLGLLYLTDTLRLKSPKLFPKLQ